MQTELEGGNIVGKEGRQFSRTPVSVVRVGDMETKRKGNGRLENAFERTLVADRLGVGTVDVLANVSYMHLE